MNNNSVLAKKPFEAYSGDGKYVFISYKHDDSAVVYRDIAELHSQGYHIWYDQGIQIDENWGIYVAKHLLGATKVLFFISQRSVQSPYVLNEIRIAIEKHIPITYIHIDNTPIPDEFLISDPSAAGKQRIVRQKQQWEDYIADICSAIPRSCQDESARRLFDNKTRSKEHNGVDYVPRQNPLENVKKIGKFAAIAAVVILVFIIGRSSLQKLPPDNPTTVSSIPENVEDTSNVTSDTTVTEPPIVPNSPPVFGTAGVKVSSYYYKNAYNKSSPLDAFDGNTKTCWQDGVDGYGEGEWLEVNSDDYQLVSNITIYNGYPTDKKMYANNSRVKGIAVSYDGGEQYFELKDEMGPQTFTLSEPVCTKYVRVTIQSVYKGKKYSDTCITEIIIG